MHNYEYSAYSGVHKLSRDEINELRTTIESLTMTSVTEQINIRCPLCGDTQLNPLTKRGFFVFHDGSWKYKCFHGFSGTYCGMYSMDVFIRSVRKLHSDFDSLKWGESIDLLKYEHILKWNSLLRQDFKKHG